MRAHINAFIQSRNVWAAAIIFGLFWIVAMNVAFYPLNAMVRSLMMWISAAVLISYGKFGWEALTQRKLVREDQLILGICVSWLGVFLQSGIIVYWRMRYPGTTVQSDFINLCTLMQILGGILHITAPGAINGRIPPRNWILLGLAFGFGVTMFVILVALGINGDLAASEVDLNMST